MKLTRDGKLPARVTIVAIEGMFMKKLLFLLSGKKTATRRDVAVLRMGRDKQFGRGQFVRMMKMNQGIISGSVGR